MKKLLSFVIVAMMIVSLVVPAFAGLGEKPEPCGEENYFDVYLTTDIDEIDPENDTEFYVYANLANNFDGFEYCKFFMVYPACLSIVEQDIAFDNDDVILEDGDFTDSSEHTVDGDDYFNDSFVKAMQHNNIDPEDVAAAGKKWTSPLVDAERSERKVNPDTGRREKVAVDFYEEEGSMLYFLFEYDATLNPNNEPVAIECYQDPEGGLHADFAEWDDPNGWANEWAYYNAFGVTIPVKGGEQPPEPQEHVHDYVLDEGASTSPTCTEPGENVYVCIGEGECDEPTYSEPVPAPGHVAGDPVEENVVEGSCTVGASKDIVTYCTVCGAEISRVPETTEAPGHTAGEAVIENVVEGTCQRAGSYDSVVYCTVCGAEISRTPVEGELGAHVKGTKGKLIASPTADAAGTIRYKCAVCGEYVEDFDVAVPAFEQPFEVILDDANAEPGEAVEIPIELKNTQYGYSDGAFYFFYDEALGDVEITAGDFFGNDVEFSVVDASEEDFADFLDYVGLEFDSTGKVIKRVAYSTASADEIFGDGTLANIAFTAPAEEGEYAIGILSEDDWVANYTVDGKYVGQIEYIVPTEIDATVTVAAVECEHVAGDPVEENRVEPADCVTDGSYDLVTYCTICGEELSRDPQVIEAPGHQPADAVEENRIEPADCVTDGSYDLVVYCSVCGAELSRDPQVIAAPGHVPADAAEENRVEPADCVTDGSYDLVVRCSVCGEILSSEPQVIEAPGHQPADAAEENRVEPADCVTDGSYDLVVYCSVCGAELSRDPQVIEAPGHTPGEWVIEGEVENQYCTVCGALLDSRPYEAPVDEPIDLTIVPGSLIASAEVDNDHRVINITSKLDKSYISYALKLDGKYVTVNGTLDDDAFAAGNTLLIAGTEYTEATEATGIRYFKSFSANGYDQSYKIVITADGKDYEYTVNVTFDHSPAASGVEPGFSANADLTGFVEGDDHTVRVVAQEGADWVAFRLLLAKGATVSVKSGSVHTMQSSDKGATYNDNGTNVDPSALAYFRTYKEEVDNYEYDLTVTYANGDSEDFHVVVSFPED